MNRRHLFALATGGVLAACTPELAVADAPRPRIEATPGKAWYVDRLRQSVLRGEEVCTRTEGPLYETCAAHLKMNEATTRVTRPAGFIYWRAPSTSGERMMLADLLAAAAWRDASFAAAPKGLRRLSAPTIVRV